jgi:hypothetical protein
MKMVETTKAGNMLEEILNTHELLQEMEITLQTREKRK